MVPLESARRADQNETLHTRSFSKNGFGEAECGQIHLRRPNDSSSGRDFLRSFFGQVLSGLIAPQISTGYRGSAALFFCWMDGRINGRAGF